MDLHQAKLAHLEQLSAALAPLGFTAQVIGRTTMAPCLKVANTSVPQLNERVHIKQTGDGTWTFCWPWDKPIGPASDLTTVTAKIATVLRAVENEDKPNEVPPPAGTQEPATSCPPATSGDGQQC